MAFRSSPNIIALINLNNHRIIDINENYTDFTGYSREEVIGHDAAEFDSWVDNDKHEKILKILKEEGRVRGEEVQFRKRSGEIHTALLSIELINIGGEPCMLTESIDINSLKQAEAERKQAETALKESEEKFSVAFRSSPEMIAISNMKKGKYIEVNDSYTRTTGYSREELIGHPVGEINMFVDPEDADKMARLMQEQGKIRNEEYKFRMKSGEIRNWLCSAEVITIGGDPCTLP